MRFDLEIKGDSTATARMEELSNRAVNLSPVLTAAGEIMKKGLAKQFDSKGAYLGGKGTPWPKLAKATVERKVRQGFNPDILRANGELEESLRGGSGHVFRVAKTQVRTGTKDYRARFHQGGTIKGEPARKLVGLSTRDREKIFSLVRKHMTIQAK